jgi:hypothetical protein
MSQLGKKTKITYDDTKQIFWLHVKPTRSFPWTKTAFALYAFNPFGTRGTNYQFTNKVQENKAFSRER